MDLNTLIKKKFHLKYVTLFLFIVLYLFLIGIIVTQFVLKSYFYHSLTAFIILFIIIIILNIIYDKKYHLPEINSIEQLYKYLMYFSESEITYLEYTESITWFYRLIRNAYMRKKDIQGKYDPLVNQLHHVLRPNANSSLSFAIKHKNSFKNLAASIISKASNESISNSFDSFRNKEAEIHYVINWMRDKNILIYLTIFAIHILGCLLISISTSFSLTAFLGNLCLYIPADIIAILLYNGIIKNSK